MATRVETMDLGPGRAEGGRAHEVFMAGVVAGLAAGIVMVLFAMGSAASDGLPVLRPLRGIGATFVGPEALQGGAGTIAYGAVLHLAFSAVLGIVFTATVPRDFPLGAAAVVGTAFALFVMALTTSYLLPSVNPVLRNRMPRLGGAWVIAHACFGATLALGPVIRRRLARRQGS